METFPVNLLFLLLAISSVTTNPNRVSTASPPIIFPDSRTSSNITDSLDYKVMQLVGIRNANDVFKTLGIRDSSPLQDRGAERYAEQAVCEPELRTVEVSVEGGEVGEIFFPKCVRVLRCGGCCDDTGRMTCTPTKVSYRDVRRAKIRIRRSVPSGAPSYTAQTVPIEVHEECRCLCKIKEENCNSQIHDYQSDLCKCVCKNEQDFVKCRNMASVKTWDNDNCKCKCNKEQHCPSGTVFSHETCSCEEE